jgi:sugar phosphate isomerase/epimerase
MRLLPLRPLVTGIITSKKAFTIALAAMVAANILAFTVDIISLIVAIILSATIIGYDYRLKQTMAGPVTMGSARFLNIFLGASPALVAQEHKVRLIQKIAIPTLSRLAKYSSDYGIQLLLEPLNRYSIPYCTTAKDAVGIASQINQDNFGLLLDSFHINIEEDSMEAAIMESRDLLRHIHLADNNRKMPGSAHINFKSIIRSLNSIEYDKYISFEPILTKKEYEIATKTGLEFIVTMQNNF